MSGTGKLILGIIIGIVALAAVVCVAVGIGCAVNGLTFTEQIVEWVGHTCPVLEEAGEVAGEVAQTMVA